MGSFLEPCRIQELTRGKSGSGPLGDLPERVIQPFLTAGLFDFADRHQPLARRLGNLQAVNRQEMLEERALLQSGRIKADPYATEHAASAQSALRCTEQGRALVQGVLTPWRRVSRRRRGTTPG